MLKTLHACYPMLRDDGWHLIFTDGDGNHLTFEDAALYTALHEDFRGPFATAEEANSAMTDFVDQTPGCGYFPNEHGGSTRADDT